MNLEDVKKIEHIHLNSSYDEARTAEQLNLYLENGWILLGVSTSDGYEGSRFLYSLGWILDSDPVYPKLPPKNYGAYIDEDGYFIHKDDTDDS